MATERLSMRKAREILRLKWVLGRTHREAARSLGISAGVVGEMLRRARDVGLDWAAVEAISDEELERRLYGPRSEKVRRKDMPDPVSMHTELRRAGVTLALLHLEYLEKHPDGYRYSAFCQHYRRWLKTCRLSMRQVHRAGEKAFVDYAGKRPHFVDPATGEAIDVELFVAVLGASNYTFAEATATQRTADFIKSHIHAFAYFSGVTSVVVPDQLKTGVSRPCRYEPELQRTYDEMARHYDTVVIPARPRKPRDKAKVEVAVQVVERWLLARIRNEEFFSLDELNARLRELLDELNARPMKTYGGKTRRELFEEIDRPALKPLPGEPYVLATWKTAKVNIDYHVEVDHHYYSVPHALIHEHVDVRITDATVEVFYKTRCVVAYPRSFDRGGHTTRSEHMPKAHQKHLEWTPSRILHWAETIGPATRALAAAILDSRPHPEMGYRSCLGILRLADHYDHQRLEAACSRALNAGARSYSHVARVLKTGLDRLPLVEAKPPQQPLLHLNVRGPAYYQ